MGTPQFAVPSLQRLVAGKHSIVGVVTQPDRPSGRGQRLRASPVKELAEQLGVPYVELRRRPPQPEAVELLPGKVARKFQVIPWRIVDLADPDILMYANFHTGSPAALANYSNPELDRMLARARSTADMRIRNADYCEIGRLINSEAIWFWTFQNTAYAIGKAKIRGVPKLYGGYVNVAAAWLE